MALLRQVPARWHAEDTARSRGQEGRRLGAVPRAGHGLLEEGLAVEELQRYGGEEARDGVCMLQVGLHLHSTRGESASVSYCFFVVLFVTL